MDGVWYWTGRWDSNPLDVEGDVLKCARLDIQPQRTRNTQPQLAIFPARARLDQWRLVAPYFLKVYGLNGPEVRGHALNVRPTGLQPRRTT